MNELNNSNKKYERVLMKYRDIDDEARELVSPIGRSISVSTQDPAVCFHHRRVLMREFRAQLCTSISWKLAVHKLALLSWLKISALSTSQL